MCGFLLRRCGAGTSARASCRCASARPSARSWTGGGASRAAPASARRSDLGAGWPSCALWAGDPLGYARAARSRQCALERWTCGPPRRFHTCNTPCPVLSFNGGDARPISAHSLNLRLRVSGEISLNGTLWAFNLCDAHCVRSLRRLPQHLAAAHKVPEPPAATPPPEQHRGHTHETSSQSTPGDGRAEAPPSTCHAPEERERRDALLAHVRLVHVADAAPDAGQHLHHPRRPPRHHAQQPWPPSALAALHVHTAAKVPHLWRDLCWLELGQLLDQLVRGEHADAPPVAAVVVRVARQLKHRLRHATPWHIRQPTAHAHTVEAPTLGFADSEAALLEGVCRDVVPAPAARQSCSWAARGTT